ncbi:TRAP transporter substrate-binding protein DctP [Alcaligenaceae bacterium]|nr:TRAP transporter substrate-binding protein DctP [Alcaligenaceae bacterium]
MAAASVLWLGVASSAYAQAPIELEFGNWIASTSSVTVNALEPWKKLVEEKTKGRVKVNLYHGGVLGSSRTVLQDVKGGVYHVGFAIPAYYYDTAYFKLLLGELPFAMHSSTMGSKVMNEYVKRHAQDIFGQLGVLNMGIVASDPYVMLSTSPIRTINDLKGKRLRVPGKAWVPIAKGWGAIPTPMQPENAYTALERGTLDIMQYTPASAAGWKYYEVAPYITKINSPTVLISLIMNKGFYEKLPADLQKMFNEELSPALGRLFVENYDNGAPKELARMAEYFKAKGKGEVIDLSPEERAKFVATTKPAWDEWIAEADTRKMDGKKSMEIFKTIMKENGLEAPF